MAFTGLPVTISIEIVVLLPQQQLRLSIGADLLAGVPAAWWWAAGAAGDAGAGIADAAAACAGACAGPLQLTAVAP